MKKCKISILTTKWGHLSIAKAIKDELENKKYQSYFNQIELLNSIDNLYSILYKFFPNIQKIPFKLSNKKIIKDFITSYFNKNYEEYIEKLIKKEKPNIVINTYYAFNFILEDFIKKYNFTLLNIIANPRSFCTLEVTNKGYNLVFDDKDIKRCLGYGVEINKIKKTGWFTRKEFQNEYEKIEKRIKLGIPQDKLVLTLEAGSIGTNSILKIIPFITNSNNKIHLNILCGKNKQLLLTVKSLAKLIGKSKNIKTSFTVLGYTDLINEYFMASDLVIGKAGPNTLFESVATKTPFFAISHIAGQEDGNLEIISDYNIGYVEERSSKAIKKLNYIIKNQETIKYFDKSLTKLADYNKKSGKKLIELIDSIS